MEKMKYERPVMRVEAFQANAYCDYVCTRKPVFSNEGDPYIKVQAMLAGVLRTFYFGIERIWQENPLSHQSEYYYRELDPKTYPDLQGDNGTRGLVPESGLGRGNGEYFLSYNAADTATAGSPVFYLYEDYSLSGYSETGRIRDWEWGTGTLQTQGQGIVGNLGGNFDDDNYWISDSKADVALTITQGSTTVQVGTTHS